MPQTGRAKQLANLRYYAENKEALIAKECARQKAMRERVKSLKAKGITNSETRAYDERKKRDREKEKTKAIEGHRSRQAEYIKRLQSQRAAGISTPQVENYYSKKREYKRRYEARRKASSSAAAGAALDAPSANLHQSNEI